MKSGSLNLNLSLDKWLVFLLIVLVALFLRLVNIDQVSLSQDESTILEFTRGLLETGYPNLVRGEREVLMATYELVPYFIAPSVKLFGWSEFSVRLPSVLFSIATLALIYFSARKWFDYRVALIAATLYALSPWAIYWSQNAFYPSQLQFFALLSIILLYKLYFTPHLKDREFYWLSTVLVLTYLTWEASGLLFLVYGFLWLFFVSGNFGFLKRKHAWIAFSILIVIVIFQLFRRELLKTTFLIIGSNRSSISTPQLAVNELTHEPFYYIEKIFFDPQYLFLTILVLSGVIFVKKNQNLKFLTGYVFISVIAYSELLTVNALRYLYFVLPVFLIVAAAVSVMIIDWVAKSHSSVINVTLSRVSWTVALVAISFLLVGISDRIQGLKSAEEKESWAWELNPRVTTVDYRQVMVTLKQNYRDGDIIITRSPFLLELYAGLRGDYMLQRTAFSIVLYDPFVGPPYYLDKFVGNPVLRNREDLEDVLRRNKRVWFLATPLAPAKAVIGEDWFDELHQSMTLFSESSKTRLYLWENRYL